MGNQNRDPMKNNYTLQFIHLFLFGLVIQSSALAQCPGGTSPGGVAFDTTVSTSSGSYATTFSFPKINPMNSQVRCVKLCLTITGRVSMFLENNVLAPATYNIAYNRKDSLTGPGLNTPLTNNITVNYGPYPLDASDGNPLSGPDFVNIGPDTVLKSVTICHTITDSVDISQFYGTDSVTYTYKIKAGANVTGSGDYLFSVSTSGTVNYHLEYCLCNPIFLPLHVYEFFANSVAPGKAELGWMGSNDPSNNYHYEVEVSRNGHNFVKTGSVDRHDLTGNSNYRFTYNMPGSEPAGTFYFRIKQVYSSGYSRFSEIRAVDLTAGPGIKFSVYPNPSDGRIGIKFDNYTGTKALVQVYDSRGQTVVQREINEPGSSYQVIATLQKGVYWVKTTDVTTRQSGVNQLFIK